jgi:ADP-ribose pyrophosphatase
MNSLNNNNISHLSSIEEKTLSSKLIFDGKVIHLHVDDILLPNGATGIREYCTHNGAVCVIPITSDGDVICVRQYRYAIGKPLIEIPAGKLDSINENPDDAVRRELKAETGAVSGNITFLGVYYGSPAILSEKIYMYLAENLSFGECDPDDDEFLEVIKIPLDELVEMVLNGKIEDGKTQSAVLRAKAIISKR